MEFHVEFHVDAVDALSSVLNPISVQRVRAGLPQNASISEVECLVNFTEFHINAALHLQSIWQPLHCFLRQIYLAHFCLGLPTFVARRASGSSRSSGGNYAGSKDSRHQRDLTLEFS